MFSYMYVCMYVCVCVYIYIYKGKQSWSGPGGSRKIRFPDFMTTAQDGQLYAPADFTPRKYTWYSFLLEAESTPGP